MRKAIHKHLAAVAIPAALSLLILLLSQTTARAQGGPPPRGEGPPEAGALADRHRDLLHALNLTPEQLERIRSIHEQNQTARRASQQRMRQAQLALDQAIYSDNADEAVIEQRVHELAAAQAEVTRMRALTELNIRRVLTPEQLNTLRSLRQQARRTGRERRRQDMENSPGARDRFNRRPGALNTNEGGVRPNNNYGAARPNLAPRPRRGEMLRGRRP